MNTIAEKNNNSGTFTESADDLEIESTIKAIDMAAAITSNVRIATTSVFTKCWLKPIKADELTVTAA